MVSEPIVVVYSVEKKKKKKKNHSWVWQGGKVVNLPITNRTCVGAFGSWSKDKMLMYLEPLTQSWKEEHNLKLE